MTYWYKGVFLLYSKKYDEAVACFEVIIEILQKRDKKLPPEDSLTLEEQNCEVLYNIALCYLSTNKYKTLEIFTDLSQILNKKHKGQILFLCSLVELELKNSKNAEKLMEEAYKCDSETLNPFLNKQTVIIKPLNTTNNLAVSFPLLEPFENNRIKLRPAICLPKPSLPPIEFGVERKVVDYFKISNIPPKHEPPWLRRNKGSIMFTDNIVEVDHEPVSNVISKVDLNIKSKKAAKSGVLLRRTESDEKESSYLQTNEEDSLIETENDEIPEIVLRKIKELCY